MSFRHRPLRLYALLGVGIIAISFSAIFIKFSSAPVSVIAMYRLLLTCLFMLPFLFRARGELREISGKDWVKLIASGLLLGLHFLFWMGSLRFTSVASSTVLMTLEPILVMIGAFWLFHERTTLGALSGVFTAALGAVMVGWGDFGVSAGAIKGDLLSVLGTVSVVGHMLLGQELRSRISSTVYSFVVFLTAGLMFLVYNALLGYSVTSYPPREWGLFLLMALVPTVFGHILFNWLLQYVGATSISMAVLGEPVGATLLANLMLGETISPLQAASCVLLIGGVVLFLLKHRPSHGEPGKQSPAAAHIQQA